MWPGSDGFPTDSHVRYPQWLENLAGVNREGRVPVSTAANEYLS